MNVKSTFNISVKTASLILFILLDSSVSYASNNVPAISLGVTYCRKIYLIQLYDSGLVEYRGLSGVKTVGRRNTVIKPSIVSDLLKQAEDGGFFLADNRINRLDWRKMPALAIRIQQNEKSATLMDSDAALSLENEILKIKGISNWIGNEKRVGCMSDDGSLNKNLKIKD